MGFQWWVQRADAFIVPYPSDLEHTWREQLSSASSSKYHKPPIASRCKFIVCRDCGRDYFKAGGTGTAGLTSVLACTRAQFVVQLFFCNLQSNYFFAFCSPTRLQYRERAKASVGSRILRLEGKCETCNLFRLPTSSGVARV